jgi:uncharacterized membrane protein YphA (DoxX/SURF4 family)
MTVFRDAARSASRSAEGSTADFIDPRRPGDDRIDLCHERLPKLLHFQATVAGLTQRGIPEVLAYLGPPVEFFGGLALVLGFLTPYAAILILLFTIIATGTSHRFWEFTDAAQYRTQNTNFWKNISMMGGMLLLWVTEGGRYSLDRVLFRRD